MSAEAPQPQHEQLLAEIHKEASQEAVEPEINYTSQPRLNEIEGAFNNLEHAARYTLEKTTQTIKSDEAREALRAAVLEGLTDLRDTLAACDHSVTEQVNRTVKAINYITQKIQFVAQKAVGADEYSGIVASLFSPGKFDQYISAIKESGDLTGLVGFAKGINSTCGDQIIALRTERVKVEAETAARAASAANLARIEALEAQQKAEVQKLAAQEAAAREAEAEAKAKNDERIDREGRDAQASLQAAVGMMETPTTQGPR